MAELKLTCQRLDNFNREYLLLSKISKKKKMAMLCYLINACRYIRENFKVKLQHKVRTLKKRCNIVISIQYICYLAKVLLTNVCMLVNLVSKGTLRTLPVSYTQIFCLNIYFCERLVNMYGQLSLNVLDMDS